MAADEAVGTVLMDKMAAINATLNESAAITGQRIEGDDASVRSLIIAALLSAEQKAKVAARKEK